MRGRARGLLILLLAGFLLLPALHVHAQEVEQAPATEEAPASSEATMSATATGDESGGGTGGTADLPVIKNQPFTGAASYAVAIEVPPGRAKIAPNLAIAYSSYQGNGWIGVGWNLQAGAIQRSTKQGLNYASNDYVFTANGSAQELAPRGDWGANLRSQNRGRFHEVLL